jgi:membrane protein implicated in regulation of membrane protease activity
MGTAAPVGTLLWVKPVDKADLHVGEFITFRPPGAATTYSHRIYKIHSDGQIETKGQITAPDPWRITSHDIVGHVDMRWWGLGWLVKALPILVLGGLVLWFLVTRFASRRWKLPLAVLGFALLTSIAIVVYRPFTRAIQLSATPTADGGRASYVSTGLLPLRLQAVGGGHTDIRAGEIATIVSRHANTQGKYPVFLHPHIPIWFWVGLVAACLVPAIWTTIFGTRPAGPPRHRAIA